MQSKSCPQITSIGRSSSRRRLGRLLPSCGGQNRLRATSRFSIAAADYLNSELADTLDLSGSAMKRGSLPRRQAARRRPQEAALLRRRGPDTLIESRFSSVICAPIYSMHDGLSTQVLVGVDEGLQHDSSIHCDALVSIIKTHSHITWVRCRLENTGTQSSPWLLRSTSTNSRSDSLVSWHRSELAPGVGPPRPPSGRPPPWAIGRPPPSPPNAASASRSRLPMCRSTSSLRVKRMSICRRIRRQERNGLRVAAEPGRRRLEGIDTAVGIEPRHHAAPGQRSRPARNHRSRRR